MPFFVILTNSSLAPELLVRPIATTACDIYSLACLAITLFQKQPLFDIPKPVSAATVVFPPFCHLVGYAL